MQLIRTALSHAKRIWRNEFVEPVKSVRISYLPPLMIYFAAGVQGLTAVVGSFYVTKVLGLQADFLAVLVFWAGIWWAFKMPIGHLVDLYWKYKYLFIFFGAALMTFSFGIMIGLTGYPDLMSRFMRPEDWYVLATLTIPFAYVLQDIVADAMTVEAIPRYTDDGKPVDDDKLKGDHTNMQLLGRAAILFGGLIVAGASGWFARIPAPVTGLIVMKMALGALLLTAAVYCLFRFGLYRRIMNFRYRLNSLLLFLGAGVAVYALYWVITAILSPLPAAVLSDVEPYEMVYWLALGIPVLSITGVAIAVAFRHRRISTLINEGFSRAEAIRMVDPEQEKTNVNWWILGGSAAYLAFLIPLGCLSLTYELGKSVIPLSQFVWSGGIDITRLPLGLSSWLPGNADLMLFLSSFAVISVLIIKITRELPPEARRALIGTAIIIFVYRATPSVGAGLNFFYIEVLRFSEGFMGTLSQVGAVVALFGLFVLRPMMAKRSISWIFVFLTFFYSFFFLPVIGLVNGMHAWLAGILGTDPYATARGIALIDTVVESPFGQLAMVPMLAWIAKEAPSKYKATYFALMASFTNLALSAGTLGTKYLNKAFVIIKPVYDRAGEIIKPGVYDDLAPLMWTVLLISLVCPLLAIYLFGDRGKGAPAFRALNFVKKTIIHTGGKIKMIAAK